MLKNIVLVIFTVMMFGINSTSSYAKEEAHEGHDHSSHDHSSHGSSGKDFYIHGGFKVHFDTITEAHEKKDEVDESYTHSHLLAWVSAWDVL